jgi:protein-disulfide isomerase
MIHDSNTYPLDLLHSSASDRLFVTMVQQNDPRAPFVIGIVILGVVLLGGIIWAVFSAPAVSTSAFGQQDVNVTFNDDNDPTLGPPSSEVTIRLFSDYQCPACRIAEDGIRHVRGIYGGQVKIIWNDFPLEGAHINARNAANAARCAEEQGKFWEMHDAIYEAQQVWSELPDPRASFNALAEGLQLNVDAFDVCYGEKKYDAKIAADIQEGNAAGVDSTPTAFINKRKVVGVLSAADWDAQLKNLVTPVSGSSSVPQ